MCSLWRGVRAGSDKNMLLFLCRVPYSALFCCRSEERQDLWPAELEAADLLRGRPQYALHRGVRDTDADRSPETVHGLPGVGYQATAALI